MTDSLKVGGAKKIKKKKKEAALKSDEKTTFFVASDSENAVGTEWRCFWGTTQNKSTPTCVNTTQHNDGGGDCAEEEDTQANVVVVEQEQKEEGGRWWCSCDSVAMWIVLQVSMLLWAYRHYAPPPLITAAEKEIKTWWDAWD